MITAKEAKELSLKNKLSLEEVYNIIKREAEIGTNKAFIPMHDSDVVELIQKGFKVSRGISPLDSREMYVVQW